MLFFRKKEPVPILVSVAGGTASVRRVTTDEVELRIDETLADRDADVARQSAEVAIQELCEADLRQTRQFFAALVASLLPRLRQEGESPQDVRPTGGGLGFCRAYKFSEGKLSLRDGSASLQVTMPLSRHVDEAGAVRQLLQSVLCARERQTRTRYEEILQRIEAHGR